MSGRAGAARRMARGGAAVAVVVLVLGAMWAGVSGGAAAAPVVAPASAADDRSWTITLDDGVTPASTGHLFVGQQVVPSGQITDAYRIRHGAGVNGPLDVRARALSAPSTFEGLLSVTLSTPGGPATTMPLTQLLRDDGVIRVIDAIPPGDVRLQIAVGLAAGAPNAFQEDEVQFEFVITVAGTDVVVPSQPTQPGTGSGAGAGPIGLGKTGVDSVSAFVAGLVLAGFGIVVVGVRRRRSA